MSVSAAMAMQGPTHIHILYITNTNPSRVLSLAWPSSTVEAQDLCRRTKAKVGEKIEMELKTLNVLTHADGCLLNLAHWLWYLWCLKPPVQLLTPPPSSGLDVKASALFRLWNVHQKGDVPVTLHSDTNHISRQPDLQARFDVTFAVDTHCHEKESDLGHTTNPIQATWAF